jgi:hypothetical protein
MAGRVTPSLLGSTICPNQKRGHEPPLLTVFGATASRDLRQCATSVPIRLGAWPTGITALIFIAVVSIAVTELLAALET